MDFEVFEVQDDGTHVPVDLGKVNDVLSANSVVILIDHGRRKIYNFNGRESRIRTRFIGARLAAEQIRSKLGLSYSVQAVEEGEETQGFRDLLREITSPRSPSASRVLEKPPPAPPTVKIFIDKEVAPSIRPSPPERPRAAVVTEPSPPIPMKPVALVEPPPSHRLAPAPPSYADVSSELDIDSMIKQFGKAPEGTEIEAVIMNNTVYRCAQIQTKVLGKKVEQSRLEKVDNLDGIFTLDGQVKVVAKAGRVIGIQVLSKQKRAMPKKTEQSTD
nr:hypothetical protein [Candidatus Njordarchaeota archaeon]